MVLFKILPFLLSILSALFQISVTLEDESFYYIKNFADSSYLQVKSGLEECLSLGAVGTSSSLDAQSASYRWLYNQLLPTETVYLEIEDEGEETISLNEVTIYSINGGGPVCTFAYREMNIIPVSGSIYQIQNIKGEECLTSNGVESRISWVSCNETSHNQQWEFISVPNSSDFHAETSN